MASNMWGVGGSDLPKYGIPDSHRSRPMQARDGKRARAGKLQHESELEALACQAGVSVKRLVHDIHTWRKSGIVPDWAL